MVSRTYLTAIVITILLGSCLALYYPLAPPPRLAQIKSGFSPETTPGKYWFQVGAFAESESGYGDNFGEPVTGASVEIRVLSNQRNINPDSYLAYWVGIDLPNDAFIQVGYIATNGNLGEPSWFWEYFPPGTAAEASVGFLGDTGTAAVGSNGTWVTFLLASSGTTWSAYVNQRKVGSKDLGVSDAGTNGPYASAEVAGTRAIDNRLGPVEFRNLTYRDTQSVWHTATSAVSLCCYSVQSDSLPADAQYPYGVAGIRGDDNHWIAGSGIPFAEEGTQLWPWYYVTVSSQTAGTSGTGWYVKGDTVMPKTQSQIPMDANERLILTGWSQNGISTQSSSFVVSSNLELEPIYTKQFMVNVASPLGQTFGSGWYDSGSDATFSVNPTFINQNGLLGMLGVRTVFDGWQGDYSGKTGNHGQATLRVDSPKSIRAIWSTDYGYLPEIIGAIIAASLLMTYKLRKQSHLAIKTLRKRIPIAEYPAKSIDRIFSSTKYCRHCGIKTSGSGEYCRECGNRL